MPDVLLKIWLLVIQLNCHIRNFPSVFTHKKTIESHFSVLSHDRETNNLF